MYGIVNPTINQSTKSFVYWLIHLSIYLSGSVLDQGREQGVFVAPTSTFSWNSLKIEAKAHYSPRVQACVVMCTARFNSEMATLDRWFARKAKETSDSFNKASGTARNHASSNDEDRDSILKLEIGC